MTQVRPLLPASETKSEHNRHFHSEAEEHRKKCRGHEQALNGSRRRETWRRDKPLVSQDGRLACPSPATAPNGRVLVRRVGQRYRLWIRETTLRPPTEGQLPRELRPMPPETGPSFYLPHLQHAEQPPMTMSASSRGLVHGHQALLSLKLTLWFSSGKVLSLRTYTALSNCTAP